MFIIKSPLRIVKGKMAAKASPVPVSLTKRKWYCLAGFVVAFGFHKSAVVGIVIFLIYGLLTNHFKKWLY